MTRNTNYSMYPLSLIQFSDKDPINPALGNFREIGVYRSVNAI